MSTRSLIWIAVLTACCIGDRRNQCVARNTVCSNADANFVIGRHGAYGLAIRLAHSEQGSRIRTAAYLDFERGEIDALCCRGHRDGRGRIACESRAKQPARCDAVACAAELAWHVARDLRAVCVARRDASAAFPACRHSGIL